jgi:hypothetical protein
MSLFQSKRSMLCLVGLLLLNSGAASLHAGSLAAGYWAEGSTDSTGIYSPGSPLALQAGNSVIGAIPTDATSPDIDVVNYFRTLASLPGASAAYDGQLLGDLSGYTGLSATFNLYNSALPGGAPFSAADLVGEMGTNFGIRLMFMGGYLMDGVTPNEWWSNPTVAWVTSMNNGQDVTLTALFDPSQWSNYYGHVGTESSETQVEFAQALAGVTRLGLSFGSGYFFSDGFSFNTGGSAQIELKDMAATSPGASTLPEPGTLAILGGGLCILSILRRRPHA